MKTPAQLGYSFPPEWHPHTATWISWPRPEGISFPEKYETVPANLAAIAREIAKREQLHFNVPNVNYEVIVRGHLKKAKVPTDNIFFHYIKTNECWTRDHGPAFLLRKNGRKTEAAVVDWGFNAWGGKYPPYDADDAVPTRIAAELKLPVFNPGIVMEGGSVDFNGRGTILTTDACLLNENRNPGLGKEQIEKHLKDYYGQSHVVWLGEGIVGDDTDGHVDDISRFVDAKTIVTVVEDDPKDPNHEILRENSRRLALARDQDGKPFRIVELPMPGDIEHDGEKLPASYANFYFVNGACLVPTYGVKARDRKCLEILAGVLPKHEIVGINCRELIWGLGSIHCLTQQQPKF